MSRDLVAEAREQAAELAAKFGKLGMAAWASSTEAGAQVLVRGETFVIAHDPENEYSELDVLHNGEMLGSYKPSHVARKALHTIIDALLDG